MALAWTISDLHLFTTRSCFETKYRAAVEGLLDMSDALVLNGDIFDFKWSLHASGQRLIEDAVEWLTGWVDAFPQADIHFVAGNHDAHPNLGEAIISEGQRRLHYHPRYLRLGSNFIAHGDCMSHNTEERLTRYRRRWEQTQPTQPWWAHRGYGMLAQLGLLRYEYLKQSGMKRYFRVENYLKEVLGEQASEVTRVFLGHTHIPYTALEYEGRFYFNSGCAVKGMRLLPQPIHY